MELAVYEKTQLEEEQNQSTTVISYKFEFPDGSANEFTMRMDKQSLNAISNSNTPRYEWSKLSNFKCPHCPLNEAEHEYCPIAINLADIIHQFREMPSYREAKVTVVTENRTYTKETSVQSGVSSMLGIVMVSSGCPIMGKLKPLLHFHLPFASLEETQVRALSLYILSQYVKWKKGVLPDWDMQGLVMMYEDIRQLNYNVTRKIANLEIMDTSINSIVILNNFADYVTFTIDERMIDELEFFLKEFMI